MTNNNEKRKYIKQFKVLNIWQHWLHNISQSNMETEINDAREQLWHLWFSMPSWYEQRNSSASHFRGDNLPKSIFGAMMNLIILVKWLLFGIFESRRPVCNTSSKLFKFFFFFKKSPKMDFGGVMVTSLLGNLKCHFFPGFQKWHNYVATWPNPVNQPNVQLIKRGLKL